MFDWSSLDPPEEEVAEVDAAIDHLQHDPIINAARTDALAGLDKLPIHKAIAMVVQALINAIQSYEAGLAAQGREATVGDVRGLLAAFGVAILAGGEA